MTTNTGSMSNRAWIVVANIIETMGDVIKGLLLVLGILAANIADVAFGTIAIGVLFGGTNVATQYGFWWLNNWGFGGVISLASSAFQILLWSVIQRRGIVFGQIIRWRIPSEIKSLVVVTGIMWLIDTFIDVSPLALLIQNSPFQTINWLYLVLVAFVGVLVFFLCGFAEVATSNIRSALQVGAPRPTQTQSTPRPVQSQPVQNTQRPVQSQVNNAPRGQRTASGQGYHTTGSSGNH